MRKALGPMMIGLTLTLAAGAALAAPVRAKKAPATTRPPVKGTAQMAGDNGKIGVTYTLGKGLDALNFTLLRAEYATTRIAFDDTIVVPEAEEKLLVLYYTVQNPTPQQVGFDWGCFKFTAVDSENVNREGLGYTGKVGTSEKCSLLLKPAQKIEVFTMVKLPAKATVPKLIVQRGDHQPVLRLYFGKNGIKGLSAPVADPADPTGATARSAVPAQKDTYYNTGVFDVKLTGGSYTTEALGAYTLEEGERFFNALISFRNASRQKQDVHWGILNAVIKDADGEKVERISLYKRSRAEGVGGQLEPDEEGNGRFFFRLPKNVTASQLTLWEGDNGRRFVFDVSDIK